MGTTALDRSGWTYDLLALGSAVPTWTELSGSSSSTHVQRAPSEVQCRPSVLILFDKARLSCTVRVRTACCTGPSSMAQVTPELRPGQEVEQSIRRIQGFGKNLGLHMLGSKLGLPSPSDNALWALDFSTLWLTFFLGIFLGFFFFWFLVFVLEGKKSISFASVKYKYLWLCDEADITRVWCINRQNNLYSADLNYTRDGGENRPLRLTRWAHQQVACFWNKTMHGAMSTWCRPFGR